MKCPKCHYIGFRTEERCKNCGYDFSLAVDRPTAQDLPLRRERDPPGPLTELSLNYLSQGSKEDRAPIQGLKEDREPSEPEPDTRRTALAARPPQPRAPLSVRRATPEVTKSRSRAVRERPQEPTLFKWLQDEDADPAAGSAAAAASASEPAGSRSRISAALLDGGLLVAIDVTVIYFTLRLTELTVASLGSASLTPLVMFLSLLNGGYLVVFTAAGGQTLGKMAAGIRVVGVEQVRVPVGSAVLRTAAYVLSALPAGLGFLPGFFDRERRALHDRLAGTRVVKVS